MKLISGLFFYILVVSFSVNAKAQSNDNFKKLQEISLDQVHQRNLNLNPKLNQNLSRNKKSLA